MLVGAGQMDGRKVVGDDFWVYNKNPVEVFARAGDDGFTSTTFT